VARRLLQPLGKVGDQAWLGRGRHSKAWRSVLEGLSERIGVDGYACSLGETLGVDAWVVGLGARTGGRKNLH
jgi:hypothetical protein